MRPLATLAVSRPGVGKRYETIAKPHQCNCLTNGIDAGTEPAPSDADGAIETGETYVVPKSGPSGLNRALKSRHIQMIAIGSNIGTGLFVGTGKSLHTGGPLALVAGFVVISTALVIMMQSMAEICVLFPGSGSVTQFATRFWDESLGFAIGWQYWFCWISVFGAEASAFTILINYWNADPRWTPLWISIFILVNCLIHICPVRIFGEVEFVVSTLKVIAVLGSIITIWCIMGGAGPKGHAYGGEFWQLPGLKNGLYNDFKGLASVFVTCAFAAGGTEMVGVVAGEVDTPRHSLPRAVKTLMARIVIFYVVSTMFLTFVVRYDDPSLLGSKNADSSPFVLAMKTAGIHVLPDILNAIILICVISVGSTSLYTGSRVLKGLAHEGLAFKIFTRTDSRGRPYVALLFTTAIGIILAYLNCSSTGAVVFSWFTSISGMAFFLVWMVIISCHWRMRAALTAQGDEAMSHPYAFRASWYPWLSILSFVLIFFMLICQLIVSVSPIGATPSASNFFSNFIGVPVFLIMWASYKLVCRSRSKKLVDIDLQTGRHVIGPHEESLIAGYLSLNKWKRLLTFVRF